MPGIGSSAGERCSSQASAIWSGVTSCLAAAASAARERGSPPAGRPGQEAEAVGLAGGEDVGGAPFGHVEAVLDRGDVDLRADAAQLVEAHLRHPDEADLPLVLQLLDGAALLLERDLGIDAVQLPEVERGDAEPAQAVLAIGPQPLGAPVGVAASAQPALVAIASPSG